jgi:hypothetical protein
LHGLRTQGNRRDDRRRQATNKQTFHGTLLTIRLAAHPCMPQHNGGPLITRSLQTASSQRHGSVRPSSSTA